MRAYVSLPDLVSTFELLLVSSSVCQKTSPPNPWKACCALRRVLLIQYSDCMTRPTSANLFLCDISPPPLPHPKPCFIFGSMPWFCIFDGALAGAVALWRGRELRVSSVMSSCEITAVSPEETQTAQCEGKTQVFALACLGRTLFLISPACRSTPKSFEVIFHFTYFYAVILPLSFTSLSPSKHNDMTEKWVTSRWSQKPVRPTCWTRL